MSEEKEEKSTVLSKDSTIAEVFAHIKLPEDGVNVYPVTIQESDDDTQLAILIRGTHNMASFFMAKLMIEIQSMHDLQAQAEAHTPRSVIVRD